MILSNKKLGSLIGSPKHVKGIYLINPALIRNLEGGPIHVGDYDLHSQSITSMKGAPKKVDNYVTLYLTNTCPIWEFRYWLMTDIGGGVDIDFSGTRSNDIGTRLSGILAAFNLNKGKRAVAQGMIALKKLSEDVGEG